jgi:hypothetical protein
MPRTKESTVLVCATLAALLLLSGCGGAKDTPRPVSGKVTLRGKPVAAGFVRFCNPQAGVDILAPLQSNGAYEVMTAKGTGLPEGTYQVAIMPPRVSIPLGPMKPAAKPPRDQDIPKKYADPSTSGLTFIVTAGENHFDLDMKP